jgi:hypothetical protein
VKNATFMHGVVTNSTRQAHNNKSEEDVWNGPQILPANMSI